MKVIVCGGRNYNNKDYVFAALDDFHVKNPISTVVHGAANGADTLAEFLAKRRNIPSIAYPAEWNKYNKAAGFIRNTKMIHEENPEMVLAFPGGNGTAHMCRLAKENGLLVHYFNEPIINEKIG